MEPDVLELLNTSNWLRLLLNYWPIIGGVLIALLPTLIGVLYLLNLIGAPVDRIWPWACGGLGTTCRKVIDVRRGTCARCAGVWESWLSSIQGLNAKWRSWRLKKGTRKMRVQLQHLHDDLRRRADIESRKRCVAIRLVGIPEGIDDHGNPHSLIPTVIAHVNDHRDKAILANAFERDPGKFVLFLANLASVIVDDWDGEVEKRCSEGISDNEREEVEMDLINWLGDYRLPNNVVMDYLADALRDDD